MAGQPESVAALFEAALPLKPSERKAFLDQECGQDTALRQTVENLLAEDARAGNFLQHPAFAFLDKTTLDGVPSGETNHPWNGSENPLSHSLQPGQILIDRFLIVRWIATGGIGEGMKRKTACSRGSTSPSRPFSPTLPMSRRCRNDLNLRCSSHGRQFIRTSAQFTTSSTPIGKRPKLPVPHDEVVARRDARSTLAAPYPNFDGRRISNPETDRPRIGCNPQFWNRTQGY